METTYQRRKRKGLCPKCGKQPKPADHALCEGCRAIAAAEAAEKRAKDPVGTQAKATASLRKWRSKNRERANAYLREYRKRNPEKFKKYDNDHYHKQREQDIEGCRERGRIKTKRRRERLKITDPEKWAKEVSEDRRLSRLWAQRNADYFKEYNKAYRQTESGRLAISAAENRRRARKKAAGGNVTAAEWQAILERFDFRCFYCGRKFSRKLGPTMDHMIPFAKGGQHEPENIVPACRRCNSKKRTKSVAAFLKSMGFLF